MIVIEGTVGVGKTALLELLIEEGYIPLREKVLDNPILEKFYCDKKRYSFATQVYFLNQRFEQLKKAEYMNKVVMDRSIYGDEIFAEMLKDDKEMKEVEYNIFLELSSTLKKLVKPPKLLIYLEASTEETIKRINARGRSYEQNVDPDYWEKLNRSYQEYFDNYVDSEVLRINLDEVDFQHNYEDQIKVMDLIKNKVNELKEEE